MLLSWTIFFISLSEKKSFIITSEGMEKMLAKQLICSWNLVSFSNMSNASNKFSKLSTFLLSWNKTMNHSWFLILTYRCQVPITRPVYSHLIQIMSTIWRILFDQGRVTSPPIKRTTKRIFVNFVKIWTRNFWSTNVKSLGENFLRA